MAPALGNFDAAVLAPVACYFSGQTERFAENIIGDVEIHCFQHAEIKVLPPSQKHLYPKIPQNYTYEVA
jgi:hypothetical protein